MKTQGQGPVNEVTAAVAEPVVASGANGVTSFDEMEALQTLPAKDEDSGKSERKVPASKSEKNLHDGGKKPAKEAKHGKDDDQEEDREDEGEVEEQGEEEEVTDAAKSEKDAKDKASGKAKTFKVRSGDKDVELRSDTAFDVTVAGKAEKVALQDLLNNYSGKVSYERKFSELDRDRKSFHAERDDLQANVDRLYDLAVKDNNPRAAIEFLAEAIGGDPVQVWKNLRDSVAKQFEKFSALSPEERKAAEAEDELTWYRKKDESARTAAERAKQESELEKRVRTVQDTHKIPEQEFQRIYEELKSSGQLKPGELTPELVGDYYAEMQSRQELGKVIDEISPDLENKAVVVREMREIMLKNNFNLTDMRDVIAEVYGSKKAKGLVKKLKGSAPASTAKPKLSSNPISFDEV